MTTRGAEIIVAVLLAAISSSGFWAWLAARKKSHVDIAMDAMKEAIENLRRDNVDLRGELERVKAEFANCRDMLETQIARLVKKGTAPL